MSWHHAQEGRQLGPVTDAAFEALVRQGVVTATTLVWREGMAEWKPWGEVSADGTVVPEGKGSLGVGNPCAECGRIFRADDLVDLMGSPVCAACKPIRLQRLREGAPLEEQCSAYADGQQLVVPMGGELPLRCVCCNAPAARTIRRQFHWYPAWVNLLIIPGLVLALIVMLIVMRRMTLQVPLCEEHRRRRRWHMLGCVAWAVGSLWSLGMLGSQGGLAGAWGIGMGLAAVVSFLVAIWAGQALSLILRPRRITREQGRFSGASKEFLGSLPRWPGQPGR